MKDSDIRAIISTRPFRPVDLRTSDGQVYRITSPEIMVSDSLTVLLDGGQFRFIDNDNVASIRRLNGRSR